MGLRSISTDLGKILLKKQWTVVVAESCTGGMIGAAITGVPGSSQYFLGGVIAYDDRIKRQVLNVSPATLKKHGAVSGQTVCGMAKGVQRLFKTDCAIAVSGIAGPGGGTKEKPVGLVYIGIAVKKEAKSFKYRFKGTRERVRQQTVQSALKQLRLILSIKKERS